MMPTGSSRNPGSRGFSIDSLLNHPDKINQGGGANSEANSEANSVSGVNSGGNSASHI
jgi:hypothetical protein